MDAQARWRKRCHHIGPCMLPCQHQRGSHGRRHGADEGGAGGRETKPEAKVLEQRLVEENLEHKSWQHSNMVTPRHARMPTWRQKRPSIGNIATW